MPIDFAYVSAPHPSINHWKPVCVPWFPIGFNISEQPHRSDLSEDSQISFMADECSSELETKRSLAKAPRENIVEF